MSEEKRLVDVPVSTQISGTYYFVVNDNGATMQVPKSEMTRYFDNGITDWSQLLNKPFEDVDSIAFDTTGGILRMKKYHSHDNLDVLDKFSVNDENKLLFDGSEIGGSVGNIPVADGDTIKDNGGVWSADVIGNWSSGVTYPIGYFAVYNSNLYECIVANSDTEWTESHWTPIGSSGGITGTTINNWSASTDYKINDLVINETTLYQCKTEHTSGETFDETELANWTALTGARGEKGNDGYSPTASVEQTDMGCTITVTDANGTTTANLSNGKNGKDGNDGISPSVTITQTETGATISIADSNGTTTANLTNGVDGTNGVTPHIDEVTKHWFIGETDTRINAEGITTISTTSITYIDILTVDSWIGDSAPYTQTINVSGITADISPFIDLIVSDDVTKSDEEMAQWSYITKAVTSDNTITFKCNKTKPTMDLNVKIKVV